MMATAVDTIRGAGAAIRVNVAVAAQYRMNLFIWSVVSILQVVVYLSVWSAVADASGGAVGGYTAAQFAGYFLVLNFFRELVVSLSPIGEFAGYVRKGTLATHLLRPLHPMAYIGGGMLAYRLQSVLLAPLVAALLMWLFDAQVEIRAAAVTLLLVVAPLTLWTKFVADACFACSAMWLTRIDGIRGVYLLGMLLLGGQFAPLDVLPDAMATIARVLPFYWTLGYPTELAIGRAPLGDAWIAVAVLAAWSTALYALLQVTWRAGTRAYEAVGQ